MRWMILLLFFISSIQAQKNCFDSIRLLYNKEDTGSINTKAKLIFDLLSNGNYDSTFKFANSLKTQSQIVKYKKGEALSYNLLGIIYRNIGNNEKALECYLQSLSIAKIINDTKLLSKFHNNIAHVYNNQGDYTNALEHLFTSIKLKEKNLDKQGIANTFGHIGDIYYEQNNEKAIEFYQKSLKIQEELKNKRGEAIALNQIGNVYKQNKNYDKAIVCFFKSLNVNNFTNYKVEIANSLNCIGTVYVIQSNFKAANLYFNKALKIEEEINYLEGQANTLKFIGQLYTKQKKYSEALTYYKKAETKADSSGILKIQGEVFEGLSTVYFNIKKSEDAFYYYKKHILARDSILNDKNRKATLASQYKYEYEKKSLADSLTILEQKKLYEVKILQQKTNTSLLVVSLALVLMISLLIFQRITHNQKQKVSQLRNKIAGDLHDDVGSALSSIKMFASVAKTNPQKALENNIIDKIESTSSETIDTMSDIVWSINPKNDNFLLILEKMKNFGINLCNTSNIQFDFLYSNHLETITLNIEQRKNLFLIFKEALNNAVKYSNATNISVNISKANKNLMMTIFDNGIGIKPEKLNTGNGITNMKQRAENISGELNITIENGTEIKLTFRTT